MSKNNVFTCNCCKNLILDPHYSHVREFYYSEEHKQFMRALVPRKTHKRIVLCDECFTKISKL